MSQLLKTLGIIGLLALAFVGCQPSGNRKSSTRNDPYSNAIAEAEDKAQKPYIEASRPILEAIAARDYSRLFEFMSKASMKKVSPDQFGVLFDEQGNPKPSQPISEMTKEQFLHWMGEMEKRLTAVPMKVKHLYVQTVDPNELAGKGDPIDRMFNIGAMPEEIPFEIRRASIRSQIQCQLSDEAVKDIAEDLKISEEQVRSGKWPPNDMYDEESWPYITIKFVLIEEDGKLKVGYFEFMPPSMLD